MPDLRPFVVAGIGLGSVYALNGIGVVILYRTTGVVNFALGALGAVSGMITWELINQRGWPLWAAVIVAILAATILSLLYGLLVNARLPDRDAVVKASSTLGFMLMLLGAADWRWGPDPRRLRFPTDTMGFTALGVRVTATRLFALLMVVAVTVLVAAFLRHTRVGLNMRAVANDRRLSGLLGIPRARTEAVAWIMSGALAGITGLLLGALVRLDPPTLTFLVIPAIAAAVIGRLRSLPGTLVGGIALGLLEALGAPFHPVAPFRSAIPFVVTIAVILWVQRHPPLVISSEGA